MARHCSDQSIGRSVRRLMQNPRGSRPSIAASARAGDMKARDSVIRIGEQGVIRTSGCVSSEGWHVQQEKGLPGQSQKPRSLDSRVAGNQNSEAIDNVSLGKTTSHRAVTTVNAKVASQVRSPEGQVLNRRAKAAWGSRNLTDAAPSLRRGGSDSTVARSWSVYPHAGWCQASGKTREFDLKEGKFVCNLNYENRGGARSIRTRDISRRTA